MQDAPSETHTFLLTDIEGSSRRWERDDVAMDAALERHDELLRGILESHGGRWVKHTGDGALAVFPSALGAVAAAVEAQRAIAAEEWEGIGGLKARMALHTGEARARDGDFFGQSVNRAARLLDVAHGGQLLASLATEEIVREGLPPDVKLRDLGVHELEDMGRPERIFQVEADGLVTVFPPLRGTVGAQIVLPSFRTSFVGREHDLRALMSVIDQHRVVTLTGVGGSGKTRLAVEFAHAALDRFSDGVFFVDLSAVTDPDLVQRQTAQAVGVLAGGIAGSSSEPVRDRLLRAIRDQRMFIVLDNCEHLLDACADHVELLLSASPHIQVLATSREALALEGEQAWPVTSLALPGEARGDGEAASMRLLLDRVRELRPDFEPSEQDREHLGQICRQLDGLPLALELAAARLAHLAPADVVIRLDDRFRLLTGGRRRTERQQTLRATIDWSYDLLSDPERTVLRRLSVFAGSAPLEAIESVTSEDLEDEHVVDLLGGLVSQSLVVADTGSSSTRYRLLETIRLYGEDELVAAGEAEAVRDRHRDWYLGWLEALPWDLRLFSPAVTAGISSEYDNLRLALEWSAAQGRSDLVARFVVGMTGFGMYNGYGDELDRWRAAAASGELAPAAAVALDLHGACLDLWRYAGDLQTFEEAREISLRAFATLEPGDRHRALARFVLAASYSPSPWAWRAMEQAATEAADIAEAAGASCLRVASMTWQARARLYRGDPRAAAQALHAAMELPSWAPEHDGFNLQHDLAIALHLLGDQQEALIHAMSLAHEGAPTWRHIGLFDAALICAAQQAMDRAKQHIEDSLAGLDRARWQHPMALTDCTAILGAIATYEGRWEDASRLLAVSGGNMSHPALFAVWAHYRDRIRDALPRQVRHRCIDEGRRLDPRRAIEQELTRSVPRDPQPPSAMEPVGQRAGADDRASGRYKPTGGLRGNTGRREEPPRPAPPQR